MNNLNKTTCYLIGGAPRTGKTTFGKELARQHGTSSLSTDAIAGIIMDATSKGQYPALFYAREHVDVESFYRQYNTPELAMNVAIEAGKQLEEPIIIFLKRLLPDWGTVVLEGVAVTPALAERLREVFPGTAFIVTFMHDKTGKHIEENIYAKGLWRRDKSYPNDIKPKEIAYAKAYNNWFKQEAERYGMEVVSR